MDILYNGFSGALMSEHALFVSNFSERIYSITWPFCFQAMLIVAWNSGSLLGFFDGDVFRKVLTIFITAAFLNFLQGTRVVLS